MRGKKNRKDNSRLVRMPDGRLVSEEEARNLAAQQSVNAVQPPSSASKPVQLNTVTPQPTPTQPKTKLSRRERKAQYVSVDERAARQKQQPTSPKSNEDKDILEVWNEQERLKKESERLELEYELAKKMTKELKLKLKEQQVSDKDGYDESFADLLSPETKSISKRLTPHVNKAKDSSKSLLMSVRLSTKRYIKLSRLAIKDIRKSRKKTTIAALTSLLLMCGMGLLVHNSLQTKVSVQDVQGVTDGSKISTKVTPEFQTLRPADRDVNNDLGGFALVSPPNSAPAYAFVDSVNGTKIKVTQQQLPDKFKENPTELENLAKNYNATKLLQIDETNVYMGLSEKGPQTAVFTKDDMLVFIVSEQEVEEVEWVRYITNLVKV